MGIITSGYITLSHKTQWMYKECSIYSKFVTKQVMMNYKAQLTNKTAINSITNLQQFSLVPLTNSVAYVWFCNRKVHHFLSPLTPSILPNYIVCFFINFLSFQVGIALIQLWGTGNARVAVGRAKPSNVFWCIFG